MDILAVTEALADERRLAIVDLLADGERCVCDVSEVLGMSNALASHHLKKLREAGVVTTRRKGSWLHCGLSQETLIELSEWTRDLASRHPAQVSGCCSSGKEDRS